MNIYRGKKYCKSPLGDLGAKRKMNRNTKDIMGKRIRYFLLVPTLFISFSIVNGQDVNWDQLIDTWRKDFHVPGMSVGIIKDGKVILSHGYGVLKNGEDAKV